MQLDNLYSREKKKKKKRTHNIFLGIRIKSLQNHFCIFICFSFHNFFELEKNAKTLRNKLKLSFNLLPKSIYHC